MRTFILSLFLLFISPVALLALGGSDGNSNNKCDTKYPVILVHGMGSTVENGVGFWEPIMEALEDESAEVYATGVNRLGSTAQKASQWKKELLYIIAVSGAKKVNVIAHSHGTLYSRYAISNLGISGYIASHTALCGPHRGSSIADVILGILPDKGEWLVGKVVDTVVEWLGDEDPDVVENGYNLTTGYMQDIFNPNTPNIDGIMYQSWAANIKWLTSDFYISAPLWTLLSFYEGKNDSLVSVTSAKWGNFRGTLSGAWWCGGISHFNVVGKPFGITPGFDFKGFFVDTVNELKKKHL